MVLSAVTAAEATQQQQQLQGLATRHCSTSTSSCRFTDLALCGSRSIDLSGRRHAALQHRKNSSSSSSAWTLLSVVAAAPAAGAGLLTAPFMAAGVHISVAAVMQHCSTSSSAAAAPGPRNYSWHNQQQQRQIVSNGPCKASPRMEWPLVARLVYAPTPLFIVPASAGQMDSFKNKI